MQLAVCSVYMAKEVIGNIAYQDWNTTMYGHLSNNVQCLENEGYHSVIAHKDQDKTLAKDLMDELLAEVDWETTTLGEGFGHLQEILVVANTLLHPNQDQKTD